LVLENIYIKRAAQFLILFVPFLLGFFNYPLAILGKDLAFLPGDLGDARFINYILEHGYQYLTGHRDSFYNAPFFYPEKNVIALSDNMLGNLPIYACFRLLNFSREDALQMWWLAIFVLNYFVSFFCFYKYSKNLLASVLVSYLFTFSIINLVQVNYLQINAKFLVPIIFLYYFQWIKTKSIRELNIFLIVFFLQIILGIYYAIFSFVFIAIISLVHIIVSKSLSPFKNIVTDFKAYRVSILLLVAIVGISLWYLKPYMEIVTEVGGRHYEQVVDNIPKWQSFVIPHPASPWVDRIGLGDKYFPQTYYLHQYFPGASTFIVLFAILLLVFIKPRTFLNYDVKLLLLVFIITLLMTVRWNEDFSLLKIFYDVKLFGPISFVSRIVFFIDIIFLFLALNLFTRLFSLKNRSLVFGIFTLILFFIYRDHLIVDINGFSREKKENVVARYDILERVFLADSLKNKKIIALVSDNPGKRHIGLILDAMLFSQRMNVSCVNGYSSSSPPYANFFWNTPTKNELFNWCRIASLDSSTVAIIDTPLN